MQFVLLITPVFDRFLRNFQFIHRIWLKREKSNPVENSLELPKKRWRVLYRKRHVRSILCVLCSSRTGNCHVIHYQTEQKQKTEILLWFLYVFSNLLVPFMRMISSRFTPLIIDSLFSQSKSRISLIFNFGTTFCFNLCFVFRFQFSHP